MRILFVLAGLLVSLPLFSLCAFAGPLWTVTPDVQISQEYVDNLFQSRRDRESEWITVMSTGVQLQAQGRGEGFSLNYRPSYSMYHRYDEYNTLRHRADVEFWKDLKKHLRFSLNNSLTRTEQPYEPSREDTFPEEVLEAIDEDLQRGREPRTTNSARARLDYRFGPRDTAHVQYALRNEWNDNPGEEDSVRHAPSAGITYWFSRRYGIQTSGGYTHGRFDQSENVDEWDGRMRLMRNFTKFLDGYVQYRHSHVRYSGDRAGYTVYEPSAGISYRFARDGSMSAGVGYNVRDREDSDRDDRFTLNANINKTWDGRRSSFRLSGNSGYAESFIGAGAQGFTIYYHGRAVYTYALRKNLDWNVSAGYRRNIYKDQEPERRDNVYNAGTGLNYRLTRQTSMGLNYDHRRVESNLRAEEYYDNRATLTLNWRPQPRRLN